MKTYSLCLHVLIALCLLPGPVWAKTSYSNHADYKTKAGAKTKAGSATKAKSAATTATKHQRVVQTDDASVGQRTTEPTTVEQVLQYEIQNNRQSILKKQQADMGIQQPAALTNELRRKFDTLLSAELSTSSPQQRDKKIKQLIRFQNNMQGLYENMKAYKEKTQADKNKYKKAIKAEIARHSQQIEEFIATDLGKKIAHLWNAEMQKHSQHYNNQRTVFIYGELSGRTNIKSLPLFDTSKILSDFKDVLPRHISTRQPAQEKKKGKGASIEMLGFNMPVLLIIVAAVTLLAPVFMFKLIASLVLGVALGLALGAWVTTSAKYLLVYKLHRSHDAAAHAAKQNFNHFVHTRAPEIIKTMWALLEGTQVQRMLEVTEATPQNETPQNKTPQNEALQNERPPNEVPQE